MKIAVIGAGAMGSIYGGHLSLHNEVLIIDVNKQVVDTINREGLKIDEDGVTNCYYPKAVSTSEYIGAVDLLILFVKSTFSRTALEANKRLIGPSTRVMTLQNGAGHEDLLMEYVARRHIIIGTTEDNGAVLTPGHVRRGGTGNTNIGILPGADAGSLEAIKDTFDNCGFSGKIHENIQQLIWEKLFTNISLSVLTGILQVDMGYIAADSYAWKLARKLIHEAILTANSMGLSFDEETIAEKVRQTSVNNPYGCTSIRADLRDGRKTEVDNISGAVIRAARQQSLPLPYHECIVSIVHAMEGRAGLLS
ncbi:MAG: ketopantoate reductase family protein [Lachnospiraceae bacterium]